MRSEESGCGFWSRTASRNLLSRRLRATCLRPTRLLLPRCWNPSGVARPGWEGGRGLNRSRHSCHMQMRSWLLHLPSHLLAPELHKRPCRVKGCHLNRCTGTHHPQRPTLSLHAFSSPPTYHLLLVCRKSIRISGLFKCDPKMVGIRVGHAPIFAGAHQCASDVHQ